MVSMARKLLEFDFGSFVEKMAECPLRFLLVEVREVVKVEILQEVQQLVVLAKLKVADFGKSKKEKILKIRLKMRYLGE